MIPLLLGIFIAATLFGALLWAGYQASITQGRQRHLNLATVILTVATMAMITYGLTLPGRTIGAALAGTALFVTTYEIGWSRLLPLTLSALGAFALIGIPFA